MIKIRNKRLPHEAADALKEFQKEVDLASTYPKCVALAKKNFSAKNRKNTEPFDTVKKTLTAMCSGARRCMYCEDSVADEVEHFKPKDLYPEVVFAWSNYLYACGPCNGPKNNQFAVVDPTADEPIEVARKPKAKVTPPQAGKPALIDPRKEDPLTFLSLDITDTFDFSPLAKKGTVAHQRAAYTIRVLGLSSRDYLRTARENQYVAYESLLRDYITQRDAGAAQVDLDRVIRTIRRSPHPTVWAEMKRKRQLVHELADLFQQAPEALDW